MYSSQFSPALPLHLNHSHHLWENRKQSYFFRSLQISEQLLKLNTLEPICKISNKTKLCSIKVYS